MSNLLSGVRVLESAILLNGDTLGMHLADLGADVVKIESPGTGDYLRDILGQIEPRHSPAHLQVNKNKRSIALDLRAAGALDVFWDLQRNADIFIDGFAGSAADGLGIGYEAQRQHKPDIIYCQYTGFGRKGPYAGIPTHGQMMNAQAASVTVAMSDDGLVRIAENRELMWGTTGGGDGTAAGAIHAALRVVAALHRRDRTGEGAFLDASAADSVISQGWIGAIYGLNHHRLTDTTGLREPGSEPFTGAKYQYYETADKKYVLFCCIEPKFWKKFCETVGRADLIDRQTEAGAIDFGRDDYELRREIQTIIGSQPQQHWIELAIRERIPIGPANQGVASLRDDPHIAQRQIIVEGSHPIAGPFTYIGEPVIVDNQPYEAPRPAPTVGMQTREVLEEIGYDSGRIDDLLAKKVVAQS